MAKSDYINVQIDPKVKKEAENVYNVFGISLSEAINIFLHKSILVGGMPFSLQREKPNQETISAIQEAEDIISGKKVLKGYNSVDEMFADLEVEEIVT